jgi:anion-transporting  ArsA/GET3 family ATPase
MPSPSLLTLLLERRVLVVAGAGGVGKTTIAAGLALSAAVHGRRVLCLTVDPARRLADRLGMDPAGEAEQPVDPRPFAEAGAPLRGSLTMMMLDTKRTFDDLVRRHAPGAEAAARVLENEFYHYVSTQLAGTQSYMAMEKVLGLLEDERFDLVVLDTPPTAHALDFLDAPERLIETLDSAALRWLAEAFERSGGLSLSLVARSVAAVLRGVARLTGRGFLERLAEFVSELNQLFGGFRERARRVARAFRSPDFSYLLVATAAPTALSEARFFAERLLGLGMRADALVVNRVLPEPSSAPSLEDLRSRLGTDAGSDLAERVLRAYENEAALARGEREALARGAGDGTPLGRGRLPLRVSVPVFADSVHDVAALVAVSRCLG